MIENKLILFTVIIVPKNFHIQWKFDKVLTKIILHSFLRHSIALITLIIIIIQSYVSCTLLCTIYTKFC